MITALFVALALLDLLILSFLGGLGEPMIVKRKIYIFSLNKFPNCLVVSNIIYLGRVHKNKHTV